MARTVERYQNPAIGDDIKLRLFSYNSNNLSDFVAINGLTIYFLDPTNITAENPDGRRVVANVDTTTIVHEDTGTYLVTITLTEVVYTIGRYLDVWTVSASTDQPDQQVTQIFDVYPNLWYTTPIPVVYDFSFHFQPNKLRQGSIQWLMAEIVPNVPTAGDLRKYYENLAIVSDMKISIEQVCGDCMPQEVDLRTIVDEQLTDYREKRFGYWKLDTTQMS